MSDCTKIQMPKIMPYMFSGLDFKSYRPKYQAIPLLKQWSLIVYCGFGLRWQNDYANAAFCTHRTESVPYSAAQIKDIAISNSYRSIDQMCRMFGCLDSDICED